MIAGIALTRGVRASASLVFAADTAIDSGMPAWSDKTGSSSRAVLRGIEFMGRWLVPLHELIGLHPRDRSPLFLLAFVPKPQPALVFLTHAINEINRSNHSYTEHVDPLMHYRGGERRQVANLRLVQLLKNTRKISPCSAS